MGYRSDLLLERVLEARAATTPLLQLYSQRLQVLSGFNEFLDIAQRGNAEACC
jgi:hypothetical protein